jgi:hypothetical protein
VAARGAWTIRFEPEKEAVETSLVAGEVCFWEAFPAPDIMLASGSGSQMQWNCARDDGHAAHADCDMDDACCEIDDCSLNCASICDGFVDCDTSTVCSESHCDDLNCRRTGPICFDRSCCDDGHDAEPSLEALLRQDNQVAWGTPDFLPPPSAAVGNDSPSLNPNEHLPSNVLTLSLTDEHFPTVSATGNISNAISQSNGSHGFAKLPDVALWGSAYTGQTDMVGVDMYDPLGAGPGFPPCAHSGHSDHGHSESSLETSCCFPASVAAACSDAGYQPLSCQLKCPADTSLHHLPGPRHFHSHHHANCHWQPATYAHSPNRPQTCLSSHLLSSPVETPPPLDGSASSVLTSPAYVAEDDASSVCKWVFIRDGIRIVCGAFFSDAGTLQQHLASVHVGPIDGSKGYGYYCCWESCHRPDEPFSQKSKLQGHFLTHSNCMCAWLALMFVTFLTLAYTI